MNLPPGVSFLLRQSPNIVLPPCITYAFLNFLVTNGYLFIPSWVLPILSLLTLPVLFAVPIIWKDRKDARLLQIMGADPLPLLQDSSFAGTHAIGLMIKNIEDCAYPGVYCFVSVLVYSPFARPDVRAYA